MFYATSHVGVLVLLFLFGMQVSKLYVFVLRFLWLHGEKSTFEPGRIFSGTRTGVVTHLQTYALDIYSHVDVTMHNIDT